jgi:hypothetical protein
MVVYRGAIRCDAKLGFDLANSLIEAALDLIDSVTRAQVAGVIEMMKMLFSVTTEGSSGATSVCCST